MMSRILLVLSLLSHCSAKTKEKQEKDLCIHRTNLRIVDSFKRWSIRTINLTTDDSTVQGGLYLSSSTASPLDYPPGVGHCGGKYPIWQKELKQNSAVMCVENENDTCFKQFEINHQNCDYYHVYELKTEVQESVFCLQPSLCGTGYRETCKNGGTCVDERDGFSCLCPDGFSGPTCEGDPCSISEPYPQLAQRLPTNHVPISEFSNVKSGWYSVPKGMDFVDRWPGAPSCGSNYPVWRFGRRGNMEVMCSPYGNERCSSSFPTMLMKCTNSTVFFIPNWTDVCVECRQATLDILVIEDVSSSVMNINNYKMLRYFIIHMFKLLDIGINSNNVAFLSFANKAKVGFHLNTYDNGMDVMKALASNRGKGGGTLVSSALELAASDVFTYHNGDRPDADNIVLLFTDGRFKDETSLQQDIEILKAKAEIYVVTVGPVVSNTTLLELATSPAHILKYGDPSTPDVITSALNPTCGSEQ